MRINRLCVLGDVVEVEGETAEVVAVRAVGDSRQVLTLRTHSGAARFVTAETGAAAVAVPPVDKGAAVALARMILTGRNPRMPVSTIQHVLAFSEQEANPS